ncbi:hypothetical protein B0H34DRAFT_134316 [Crassisporium funariophilum]|nr:hypothetical protein B0H34DRAFT_134316 [Crassisporium funariophilum]
MCHRPCTPLCRLPLLGSETDPCYSMCSQNEFSQQMADDSFSDSPGRSSSEALTEKNRQISSMVTDREIGQNIINLELPPELMAVIFAMTCHAAFKSFRRRNIVHMQKTTPFTLGQVCRHWRAVIWSTPFIWSYVSLQLSSSPGRFQTQVELLGDWLERSGTCPLTIELFYSGHSQMHSHLVQNLTELLATNAHRCQVVDFALPSQWYANVVKYNFTILTTARCEDLVSESAGEKGKSNVFQFAPLLENIHLLASEIFIVNIKWERLVQISLQHVTLEECFFVLAKTPNLTYCCVAELNSGHDVTGTEVELRFLKDLVILDPPWPYVDRLLGHMVMPSLESLHISPRADFEFLSLPAIVDHAGCRIQPLKLDNIKLKSSTREQEILHFLHALPSLVFIDISFSSWAHEPIQHLFTDVLMCQSHAVPASDTAIAGFDDTRSYLLPNLRHFSCSGPVGVSIVWFYDILADLLQTRQLLASSRPDAMAKLISYEVNGMPLAGNSNLRVLTFGCSAREKLKHLVDDGLRLKLVIDGKSLL